MRLLSSRNWKIKEVFGAPVQPYAILSHTWGSEEISYQELVAALGALSRGEQTPQGLELQDGFRKIKSALMQAAKDGFDWVWVDTCCIDKTSSTELSEAINSMFRWYQESKVCYVYLSDVEHGVKPAEPLSSFQRSRWFTRGWTLQELLAPSQVLFFTNTWTLLGERSNLSGIIGEVTKIQPRFLSSEESILHKATIAQRMSWAARRHTTRLEDAAYCLLGIFDINMPLLYGEGTKAFKRLQQEIINNSYDLSIFAWDVRRAHPHGPPLEERSQLLAQSPADFEGCDGIVLCHSPRNTSRSTWPDFDFTKRGLRIQLPVVYRYTKPRFSAILGETCNIVQSFALLGCHFDGDFDQVIALQFDLRIDGTLLTHGAKMGQQVVRIRCQPSRTRLISDVRARKADILPLLIVDEVMSDDVFQPSHIHGWGPEHDLGCQYFTTSDGSSVVSPPILVRQHSDISRVEMGQDAPLEVLNRGLSCIVREKRASKYQAEPLYAHFHCCYRTQNFLLRIRIRWAFFQRREVGAMLSRTCEELSHEVNASSPQLKWSSSLDIGDQRLYITAKEENVMGNRVFVVSFDKKSRNRIRRVSLRLLSPFSELVFSNEGRGRLSQRPASSVVTRLIRPSQQRRLFLGILLFRLVFPDPLVSRRAGFGIAISRLIMIIRTPAQLVDMSIFFRLLPFSLLPRIRGKLLSFSSIMFMITGLFAIGCHIYPTESKEERTWEDFEPLFELLLTAILLFFEFS